MARRAEEHLADLLAALDFILRAKEAGDEQEILADLNDGSSALEQLSNLAGPAPSDPPERHDPHLNLRLQTMTSLSAKAIEEIAETKAKLLEQFDDPDHNIHSRIGNLKEDLDGMGDDPIQYIDLLLSLSEIEQE